MDVLYGWSIIRNHNPQFDELTCRGDCRGLQVHGHVLDVGEVRLGDEARDVQPDDFVSEILDLRESFLYDVQE